MDKIHKFIYFSLFGVLAFSLLYLFSHASQQTWEWYGRAYFILLMVSTWYFFILLFLFDVKRKEYLKYTGEMIWVIMPVFNERPALLERSIRSILDAKGTKELIIVNDGSTEEIGIFLDSLKKKLKIRVFHFPENKGKRFALHFATKKIQSLVRISKYAQTKDEYIVTVDSDTVLDEDALIRVVEPLKSPKIGATTGDIRLLNEKKNLLTRMVGTYYWIGLNIYKKSQSALGMVVCCSGCLAAYRKEVFCAIVDDFISQKFLGSECTHSEDRHLTNLVLKRRYDVIYVPEAIAYTETPSTVLGFLKQQQRWKRGYIRESIFTLGYAWKTRKILFLEILFWDLTMPFFTLGMRIAMFGSILFNPVFFITAILPMWLSFMFMRYIFLVFYAREKIPGLFVYALFYEVFLYWQNIYALFTVKNKSWITRGS